MAEAAIALRITPQPAEAVPLTQCLGRTLREDVHAERENPPFDRVCMDGIAVRAELSGPGKRRFWIAGTQGAGVPPQRR